MEGKHFLWYANLTVSDLHFGLRNYHRSHTLCLVCLIHASLNGRPQVTILLLDIIVFRRYQHTDIPFFVYEDGAMQVLLHDIEILAIVWSY